MGWVDLARMSTICKFLWCRHLKLTSSIVQRTSSLLQQTLQQHITPTPDELANVAVICQVNKLFPRDFFPQMTRFLDQHLSSEPAYLSDLEHTMQYAILSRKLYFMKDMDLSKMVLSRVSARVAECDHLSSRNLFTMSKVLYQCNHHEAQVRQTLANRADQLLHDPSTPDSVAELLNLSYPVLLNPGCPAETHLWSKLEHSLANDEYDPLSLLRLFYMLPGTVSRFDQHQDTLAHFYTQLASKAQYLPRVPPHLFQRTLDFIVSYQPLDQEPLDEVLKVVDNMMHSHYITDQFFQSSVATLCVSRPFTPCKKQTLASLLSLATNFPFSKLCGWLGIISAKLKWHMLSSSPQPQLMLMVESFVQREVSARVESASHAWHMEDVSSALRTVLSARGPKDPALLGRLFDVLEQQTADLSDYRLGLLLPILNKMMSVRVAYYSQALCENLIDYLQNTEEPRSLHTWSTALRFLIYVGHDLTEPDLLQVS